MTRAEEHRQQVEAEVLSWGLKPHSEFDGKHLVVQWRLADGQKRRFTASSTPSHWRTTLNECARIRRIMRQDQVKRPEPQAGSSAPRSFSKHFELPAAQAQRPDSQRIAALEEKLGELTDLLVDLLSRGIPAAQAPKAQPAAQPPSHTFDLLPSSLRQLVPLLRPNDLIKPAELSAKLPGTTAAAIGQRLSRLRDAGIAVNVGKQGWKLVQSAEVNRILNGGACHGQEAESRTGASAPRGASADRA